MFLTGDSNVVAEYETAGGGDDAGEEDVERHLAGVFFPRTCGDHSSTCHWRFLKEEERGVQEKEEKQMEKSGSREKRRKRKRNAGKEESMREERKGGN